MEGSTSFYSSEEEFKNYLMMTSFYSNLQKNLVALVPPKSELVFDIGTGTGSTAIQIAKKCPKGVIYATDIREEIVDLARQIAEREGIPNMRFARVDMNQLGSYLSDNNLQPDVITALFAFHHVEDPLENKQRVASEMYESMKKGGKLIIGDLYLELDYKDSRYAESTTQQYQRRAEESYNSVFWAVVREMRNSGKDLEETMKHAHEVAEYSKASELNALKGALKRSGADVPEYIITRDQMKGIMETAGFKLISFQPINSIGEAVLLAEK